MASGSGWAEVAFGKGSGGHTARGRRDYYSKRDWSDIEDIF